MPTSEPLISNTTEFHGQSFEVLPSVSIGANHDSVLGNIFTAHYIQSITEKMALGALFDYGNNEYRVNLTPVFQLTPKDTLALTAEHLNQTLPYQFDSGTIDQSIKQNAFGFEVQHQMNNAFFENIFAKAYTVKAQGVDLSSITYIGTDNNEYINQRHIAPGQVSDFSLGTNVHFSKTTLAHVSSGVDYSRYDTYYSDDSTTRSLATELSLMQRLSDQSHLKIEMTNHSYYDTYKIQTEFSPFLHGSQLQFFVFAERLIAQDISSENSNTFGVGFNFLPQSEAEAENALFNSQQSTSDLLSLASTPVVYFDRVLTKVDQKTTLAQPQNLNATLTNCSYDTATSVLNCAGQNLLTLGSSSTIYRHYSGSSCSIAGIYNAPAATTFTNTAYGVDAINLVGVECNMSLCNDNTCSDKETNSVAITGT